MIVKNDIVKHEKLGKGRVVDLIRCDGIAVVKFEDTQEKYIVTLNQLQPTEETKVKTMTKEEFIRCLEIEHDIMLLENQIKNLTKQKDELVKKLECLKEQNKD